MQADLLQYLYISYLLLLLQPKYVYHLYTV
nr:MAG TPA: hypothetical protein [Caudoviricetes sp.]